MRRADRDYLAQRGFRLSAPDGRVLFEGLRSRLLVGSAPGCDVRIDDPTVSRHHCELTAGDTAYSVRDLDSTNGTRLDGTEVYRAPLPPGAELALGEVRLRFEPLADLVPVTEADRFGELIGSSAEMRRLFGLMERLAATELTCVLCGETGTGKELAARALHDASSRADAPFVVVDCGAVSASLVESELFGHERGAYTGADAARAGAFEDASGGTVFLDEIGELPLELQPKLLRVLERREVKRLGATRHLTVDVREIGRASCRERV
jgi:two-component system, NtrC family, response regulator GlrR